MPVNCVIHGARVMGIGVKVARKISQIFRFTGKCLFSQPIS